MELLKIFIISLLNKIPYKTLKINLSEFELCEQEKALLIYDESQHINSMCRSEALVENILCPSEFDIIMKHTLMIVKCKTFRRQATKALTPLHVRSETLEFIPVSRVGRKNNSKSPFAFRAILFSFLNPGHRSKSQNHHSHGSFMAFPLFFFLYLHLFAGMTGTFLLKQIQKLFNGEQINLSNFYPFLISAQDGISSSIFVHVKPVPINNANMSQRLRGKT